MKTIRIALLSVLLAFGAWHYVIGPGWYYLRVVWTVDRMIKVQTHGQEYIR